MGQNASHADKLDRQFFHYDFELLIVRVERTYARVSRRVRRSSIDTLHNDRAINGDEPP